MTARLRDCFQRTCHALYSYKHRTTNRIIKYSAGVFIIAVAPVTVYMALANRAQGPFFTAFGILAGKELE